MSKKSIYALEERIKKYNYKDVKFALKYKNATQSDDLKKDILRYYIRKFENDLGSVSRDPMLNMNRRICNSIRVINSSEKINQCEFVSGFAGTNGKIEVGSIKNAVLIDTDIVKADNIECDILNAKLVITNNKPNVKIGDWDKIKIVNNN